MEPIVNHNVANGPGILKFFILRAQMTRCLSVYLQALLMETQRFPKSCANFCIWNSGCWTKPKSAYKWHLAVVRTLWNWIHNAFSIITLGF